MGTNIDVWSESVDGWESSRRLFEETEQAFSRFRSNSELSLVNRNPRAEVPVSRVFGDLLEVAMKLRKATDGLVDVAVGGLVAAWGYDKTFADVTRRESDPVTQRDRDWSYDTASRALTRAPGLEIDFGGIAKGWTADRVVENGMAVVAAAGGDTRSADPTTVVPVEDGLGGSATTVLLGVGALATSSTARRRWEVAGRKVSHLIDTRTGEPVASPIVTATAVADTAVEAEAAAKMVLILGEKGLAWADRTSWVRSALAVWSDGSVYSTAGLKVAV